MKVVVIDGQSGRMGQLLIDRMRNAGLSCEILAIGTNALRIISFHFPIAAFCIVMISSFQALGNGIYASIVSLFRQLIALLPAAYLLSLSGNVDIVWWCFPIAEIVSVTVCLVFFLRIYRKKIKPLFD